MGLLLRLEPRLKARNMRVDVLVTIWWLADAIARHSKPSFLGPS